MKTPLGLVIGIGNRYRRDDGVGPVVKGLVRDALAEEVAAVEGVSDALALIEMWDRRPFVIMVDCMVSGANAGQIRRIDAMEEEIPEDLFSDCSTHFISIVRAVELGSALERLPLRLIIYGIEGVDFEPGSGLTPAVASAAFDVARLIVDELVEFGKMTGRGNSNA